MELKLTEEQGKILLEIASDLQRRDGKRIVLPMGVKSQDDPKVVVGKSFAEVMGGSILRNTAEQINNRTANLELLAAAYLQATNSSPDRVELVERSNQDGTVSWFFREKPDATYWVDDMEKAVREWYQLGHVNGAENKSAEDCSAEPIQVSPAGNLFRKKGDDWEYRGHINGNTTYDLFQHTVSLHSFDLKLGDRVRLPSGECGTVIQASLNGYCEIKLDLDKSLPQEPQPSPEPSSETPSETWHDRPKLL